MRKSSEARVREGREGKGDVKKRGRKKEQGGEEGSKGREG